MTAPALGDTQRWLIGGTSCVLARVDVVDLGAASLLPGWRNAHVVAHLARNADALCRLAAWARTGVETPMYASPGARGAEIERDALRDDDVLRADAHASADLLAEALQELTAENWDAEVRSAKGRLIPAREIPWMRVKEVWLHAVDLGFPLAGIPPDLADTLCADVAAAFGTRPDPPGLRLVSPQGEWNIGDGARWVSGPAHALLGWLVGRSDASGLTSDGPLPVLPAWL